MVPSSLFCFIFVISQAGQINRSVITIFISLTIGVLIHYFCPIMLPWSIDTAFIFSGMFGIGYLAAFSEQNYSLVRRGDFQYLFPGRYFYYHADFAVLQWQYESFHWTFWKNSIWWFSGAVSGSIFIMITSKKLPAKIPALIISIGKNSLHIMALHLFVFEIARILSAWLDRICGIQLHRKQNL